MSARMPAARGRPDANQAKIVAAFEACMCSVVDLSKVGFGCPDLLIGLLGSTALVEVKTVNGKLGPAQERFVGNWRGGKVYLVRTTDDVIDVVRQLSDRVNRGRTANE